jgi:hypothetical protein
MYSWLTIPENGQNQKKILCEFAINTYTEILSILIIILRLLLINTINYFWYIMTQYCGVIQYSLWKLNNILSFAIVVNCYARYNACGNTSV